jgi:hypothetical protein
MKHGRTELAGLQWMQRQLRIPRKVYKSWQAKQAGTAVWSLGA